jgi:hypothetical protein
VVSRPRALVAAALLAVLCASPAAGATGAAAYDAYQTAVAGRRPLGDFVVEYSENRIGPARAILEDHRLYRSADGRERNETIAVNGLSVVPAIVRFSTSAAWPYDVQQFLVDPDDYNVLYLGTSIVDGRHVLAFSAVRTTTGDFSITGLFLDPVRYLPVHETFDVQGVDCRGSGAVSFGPDMGRWIPLSASVACSVAASGATFRESIKFSNYQFPASLPPEVFGASS